jgi:hypothetical protein
MIVEAKTSEKMWKTRLRVAEKPLSNTKIMNLHFKTVLDLLPSQQ